MTQANIMIRTLRLGASLLALTVPVAVQAVSQTIFSDTSWTASDATGASLGNAKVVPANAAWTANIPGASWIWVPNPTSPASNAEFVFQTVFWLCGDPLDGGTIEVAADNYAEVRLNNTLVAQTPPGGSSQAFTTVTSATNISRTLLYKNLNVIQVKVKNESSSCQPDDYGCNPAGVLLKASFEDALAENPKCSDGSIVGTKRYPACAPPQTGSKTEICACVGPLNFWANLGGDCVTRCTDKNGNLVDAGSPETLACPLGQAGLFHICQPNGSWGPQQGVCGCTSGSMCGGRCVELATDPMSCGQCGNECPAGGQCAGGVCGCPPGNIVCFANNKRTCVAPKEPRVSHPEQAWCGKKNPVLIECDCAGGLDCRPDTGGQLVSTDFYCQKPLPTCTKTAGNCTGAHGFGAPRDVCITANGVTQCCHSNALVGSFPWIVACDDGTVGSKGCTGPCY